MKVKLIIAISSLLFITIYTGSFYALLPSLLELLAIFSITHFIYQRNRLASYIVNSCLSLIYYVQIFVLLFSNEFISTLMLENMNMTGSISDSMPLYLTAAAIAVILSFLPIRLKVDSDKFHITSKFLIITIALSIVVSSISFIISDKSPSPIAGLIRLGTNSVAVHIQKVRSQKNIDREKILESFRKETIPGSFDEWPKNRKKPNIILFLCEGMSAEVLDINNNLNLNLTPNLNELQKVSISFDNYYNHTAATIRGIRGQLYSSYQTAVGYTDKKNGFLEMSPSEIRKKSETDLISLSDILKKHGYRTGFIDAEPGLLQMSEYLKSFNMDTIYTTGKNLSDKETFRLLEQTVNNESNKDEPFLICCYNTGTHLGQDSPDLKYGNGKSITLNRFHNFDHYFGEFFRKMKKNCVFENTILIFTADHASYNAPEFINAFKSKQEYFIAPIPFMIYWDGIQPRRIDADCRNSLDMTPTVLDILNIENHTNYFLGTSLFNGEGTEFDRAGAIGHEFYIAKRGRYKRIKGNRTIKNRIKEFYMISLQCD